MNPPSDQPLTPEERALAERLRRLGAHDGPPPALDAKILAAARAASTPQHTRRRRRFALVGLPASLLTAAGTAAAFVLAVGLVWQLRPQDRPPLRRVASSAPADDGFVMAEIIVTRNEPPAAAAPGAEVLAPVASSTRAKRAAPTGGSSASAVAAAPRQVEPDGTPSARMAAATPSTPAAEATSPAAVAAPAEGASGPDPAEAVSSQTAGVASSAQVDGVAPRPRASYTRSALATAERPAARPRSASRSEPPAALVAAIPVGSDSELPPAEWLQRVRDRRDAGNVGDARESLLRFRAAHPRVRIPPDLRRLLR